MTKTSNIGGAIVCVLLAACTVPEKDPLAIVDDRDVGTGGARDVANEQDDTASTEGDAASTADDAQTDPEPPLPGRLSCLIGCTTAADCSDLAPTMWECLQGVCSYVGCANDESVCPDGTGCAMSESEPWRGDCNLLCNDTADCPNASEYQCDEGVCRYVGCPNDDHCEASGTAYDTCHTPEHGLPFCADSCAPASDCNPDFPAPLTCSDEGICIIDECTTDAECQSWWSDDRYRCVRWDFQERRIID